MSFSEGKKKVNFRHSSDLEEGSGYKHEKAPYTKSFKPLDETTRNPVSPAKRKDSFWLFEGKKNKTLKKKSEKAVYSERRGKKMCCSQTVRSLLLLKRKMKHVPSQIMTKTCGNICLKLSRSGSLRKPHPELSGTQSLVRGIIKRGRDVPLHPSQILEFK